MMKDQPLDKLQRWMQAVIIHPAGVEAGMVAPAAQAHLQGASAALEEIIQPSRCQSSIERLTVYANAYYARLIECLQADFPVFRHAVGDDIFAEFAVDYLQRYASQSYTLEKLGDHFVNYLNETKPATADIENWSDFLIDLAHLERTIGEVFDGPGLEGQEPQLDAELSAIDPDRWGCRRLAIAPCLRLLALRFEINNYYTAVKANQEPVLPARNDSWLAVTRRGYIVRRYPLNRLQFVLLDQLQCGETVGRAIKAAAAAYEGSVEQLAADLRELFRVWAGAPMFSQILGRKG